MANSSYPQIREFQGAHRKLLRDYIAAIDLAASLPFFVNIARLLAPNEKEDTYTRLNRKFFALLAPLTWKPFVRLLVDMHIKAKAALVLFFLLVIAFFVLRAYYYLPSLRLINLLPLPLLIVLLILAITRSSRRWN